MLYLYKILSMMRTGLSRSFWKKYYSIEKRITVHTQAWHCAVKLCAICWQKSEFPTQNRS